MKHERKKKQGLTRKKGVDFDRARSFARSTRTSFIEYSLILSKCIYYYSRLHARVPPEEGCRE